MTCICPVTLDARARARCWYNLCAVKVRARAHLLSAPFFKVRSPEERLQHLARSHIHIHTDSPNTLLSRARLPAYLRLSGYATFSLWPSLLLSIVPARGPWQLSNAVKNMSTLVPELLQLSHWYFGGRIPQTYWLLLLKLSAFRFLN